MRNSIQHDGAHPSFAREHAPSQVLRNAAPLRLAGVFSGDSLPQMPGQKQRLRREGTHAMARGLKLRVAHHPPQMQILPRASNTHLSLRLPGPDRMYGAEAGLVA
jgi:hypothetical protein